MARSKISRWRHAIDRILSCISLDGLEATAAGICVETGVNTIYRSNHRLQPVNGSCPLFPISTTLPQIRVEVWTILGTTEG